MLNADSDGVFLVPPMAEEWTKEKAERWRLTHQEVTTTCKKYYYFLNWPKNSVLILCKLPISQFIHE